MPHRTSDYNDLCAVCKHVTVLTCLRCGRPLCESHYHDQNERCDDCEDQFTKLTKVERHVLDCAERSEVYTQARRPFVYLPFATFGLIFAFTASSAPAMWFATAAVLGAGSVLVRVTVPPTAPKAKLRMAMKRRKFLKQQKRRARKLAGQGNHKQLPVADLVEPTNTDVAKYQGSGADGRGV